MPAPSQTQHMKQQSQALLTILLIIVRESGANEDHAACVVRRTRVPHAAVVQLALLAPGVVALLVVFYARDLVDDVREECDQIRRDVVNLHARGGTRAAIFFRTDASEAVVKLMNVNRIWTCGVLAPSVECQPY